MPTLSRKVTGPVLVSLGAAGWGAENLFRSRLRGLGLAAYPIVVVEHILQVIYTLPHLVRHRHQLATAPRRALAYVFVSGAVGSALGTACYTAALGTSMNKTVAAVLLNLQPVVSTLAGAVLLRERIGRPFFVWAPPAVVAGMAIAVPGEGGLGALRLAAQGGLLLVLATVAMWGLATAASRGAMRDLPLGLATPLRLWAGLLTAAGVLAVRLAIGSDAFDPAAFLSRAAIGNLLLLTTLTGVLPLVVYFAGLRTTPAALAGYCEMFYTLSATLVGWVVFGEKLWPHQSAAAVVLVLAIAMLNRSRAVEPQAGDGNAKG